METLQIVLKMNLEFLIIFSFINSINNAYYSKTTKTQKNLIFILSFLGCIITEVLDAYSIIISNVFLIILLFIIQKYILNHTSRLIVLSDLVIIYSNLYIKMFSLLTTKLIVTFTKNITNDAIFFTNITLNFILNILLYFLITKFIFNKDERFSEVIDNFKFKNILFVLSSLILITIPNIIIYNYNVNNNNLIVLIINICTISISAIIFFIFSIKEKQYQYTIFDLEQEQLYNQTLCEVVDSLRLLKHDYNNILQSINGYIITKQYDSLDKHIKNLINYTKDISNLECINPKVINQPAIYGIIISKYNKAKNKNIPFRIEVFEDISSISFDATKLSRILGILLDNAIEAAEHSDNPLVEIKFIYNTNLNTHMIKIKNTFEQGKVIDTKKIFEKGESSKKKKSGLGLWEVKKILSTVDDAYIYADVKDNNKFEQTLVC